MLGVGAHEPRPTPAVRACLGLRGGGLLPLPTPQGSLSPLRSSPLGSPQLPGRQVSQPRRDPGRASLAENSTLTPALTHTTLTDTPRSTPPPAVFKRRGSGPEGAENKLSPASCPQQSHPQCLALPASAPRFRGDGPPGGAGTEGPGEASPFLGWLGASALSSAPLSALLSLCLGLPCPTDPARGEQVTSLMTRVLSPGCSQDWLPPPSLTSPVIKSQGPRVPVVAQW